MGCVIVRDGKIVGEGWHRFAGEPHAEVHALAEAGDKARGATAYVTLEPCAHHGRTPPCADALIRAGIRAWQAQCRIQIQGLRTGLRATRAAGVEVRSGLLEDAARELNIGFVSRMTRSRPWVRLKAAASLDGRTALANGSSQWITGPEARRDGHRWRARSCAILTGIGTVRDDDPQLTVRAIETRRQPLRIVIDARLETPPQARILDGGGTLIACAQADPRRRAALEAHGAEIIELPNPSGKVDLPRLMQRLAERGINELLAEAGFKLNGSLVREGCVDELVLYLAPSLLGPDALGLFNLPAIESLAAGRKCASTTCANRPGPEARDALGGLTDRVSYPAHRALGIPSQTNAAPLHRQSVKQHQTADRRIAETANQL